MKFLVDSIDPSGWILGRNIDRKDISVGSIFTQITKTQRDGSLPHLVSTDLGAIANISLTLKNVEFYRRKIDVVPGGHSAGLLVEGNGLDRLTSVLEDRIEKENVFIVVQ